jgi:alanyl-tRNA synthetase
VRRLTTVTGREAVSTVQKLWALAEDLSGRFNCKPEELAGRVEALQEEVPAAPVDQLRQKAGRCVVLLGWVEDGKVGLLAGVTADLTKAVKAGDLVKEVAPLVGGKGGGRPDMAQAGGSEPAKLAEALQHAKAAITAKLEGVGSGGA